MRPRHWILASAAIASALLLFAPDRARVRVATFNIETFPDLDTAVLRVAETITETDADIIAVQEIRNGFVLELALMHASTGTDRDWTAVLSRCGAGTWFSTGLVYDRARWQLAFSREYPGLVHDDGRCRPYEMSGMLGVFDDGDARIAVLSVHFRAMPEGFGERQIQWRRALAIAGAVERELGVPVVVLGDMNSTGFLGGEPTSEPEFIRRIVAARGFELQTDALPCSEYWRPRPGGGYSPSLLDHIVTRGGEWSPPEVRGYCERLECAPTTATAMDPDYFHVSDHCPVVIDGVIAH